VSKTKSKQNLLTDFQFCYKSLDLKSQRYIFFWNNESEIEKSMSGREKK